MLDLADIAEVVADAVKEATAPLLQRIVALEQRELLLPEKGGSGEPGERGADGRDGKDGADGVGLADALIDKDGNLVLTFTDGRTKSLGPVHGKDGELGAPGKDGADGLGFEHMNVEQVNERTLRFLFKRDAEEAEVDVTFPLPIYRGVFKESGEYERGDLATWAGSLWHCNEPKGLKPGEADSGWQLAAKAGRPGKDAR